MLSSIRTITVHSGVKARWVPLVLVLVAGALLTAPTPAGARASGASLLTSPQDVGKLPTGYRQWLEEQVVWIITSEEREVFLRLRSDARRDLFIENFWKVRDPSPGTVRNEYREMHYDRLDYANRAFGHETPVPGSLTDRGRVWILLGEPRSRTTVDGGRLVPSEIWFYSVDPELGTPPHFSLIFFRDAGLGEYRLWSPSTDRPERLLTLAARQTLGQMDPASRAEAVKLGVTDEQSAAALVLIGREDSLLADAALTLVPTARSDRVARGEMLLSALSELPEVLMPETDWTERVLSGEADSTVRFDTLPVAAEAVTLIRPDGRRSVHLTTRIDGERLEILDAEGQSYVGFELGSSFRNDRGEPLLLNTPQVLDAPLTEQQVELLETRDFQYVWNEELPAGATTVGIELASLVTREFGRTLIDLTSTAPEGVGVEASRPFLLREIQNLADSPPPAPYPFQLGQLLLLPAIDGPFPATGTVGVYWQLRVIDAGARSLLARFVLRDHAGEKLGEWGSAIDTSGASANGLINHLARVTLPAIPAGSYRLECALETPEGHTGKTVTLPLRVATSGEEERPILYLQPNAPPEPRR